VTSCPLWEAARALSPDVPEEPSPVSAAGEPREGADVPPSEAAAGVGGPRDARAAIARVHETLAGVDLDPAAVLRERAPTAWVRVLPFRWMLVDLGSDPRALGHVETTEDDPPTAAWEVYGPGGYASDDQVATGRTPTLEAARACVEAVAAQGPCGVGR
jgi:hypothetical protein